MRATTTDPAALHIDVAVAGRFYNRVNDVSQCRHSCRPLAITRVGVCFATACFVWISNCLSSGPSKVFHPVLPWIGGGTRGGMSLSNDECPSGSFPPQADFFEDQILRYSNTYAQSTYRTFAAVQYIRNYCRQTVHKDTPTVRYVLLSLPPPPAAILCVIRR